MTALPCRGPNPAPAHVSPRGAAPHDTETMTRIGALADETGRSIVDLAGALHQIDIDAAGQLIVVEEVADQARDLTRISHDMTDGLKAVAATNARALETVRGSVEGLRNSARNSRDVASWVGGLDQTLASVEETLNQVRRANQRIAEIAKQVNILAINARIEAARAGDMGRGFAVVAEAINALSRETSSAAGDVTGSTGTLADLIKDLRHDALDMSGAANEVIAGATQADEALSGISRDVHDASTETDRLSASAGAVSDAVERFAPAFEQLNASLHTTADAVQKATRSADEIVDKSETAVQLTVQMGAVNRDGHMIEVVQDLAGRVGALFERAIAEGRISERDLFDATYRPIEGTSPQQVVAPYTAFTDQMLPALQEPVLDVDPRIVFCAAVDRNGYLPTHNKKFSHPQGDDPVWNASHSRNRRIFDDRVGLKAGCNTEPFLMQSYRRDMGGGEFALMKDVSAPITVRGRHWGGFRMGFTPAN